LSEEVGFKNQPHYSQDKRLHEHHSRARRMNSNTLKYVERMEGYRTSNTLSNYVPGGRVDVETPIKIHRQKLP
jgi:hypothetical protein